MMAAKKKVNQKKPRRAFHDRFHRDIRISRELVKRPETKDKNNTHPEITEDLEDLEELLDGESDYSLWHARDNMWMRKKQFYFSF